VAILEAEVERDRAAVAKSRALIRAPLKGIVTYCDVRPGERVRKGDLLYRVEDPASLIVYGDIPVRQAVRVEVGNPVRIDSTATPGPTKGEVVLVAPTVNEESGTVAVKVRVEPGTGFKPGLFVTLLIVSEQRDNALIVPKRSVLHHDEDGAYLFVVKGDVAERRVVTTGFQREEVIEITKGLAEDEQVVIEGQDTLADGAKVKREGE
jgi:membrane fusion protein (multidrug efflux system)